MTRLSCPERGEKLPCQDGKFAAAASTGQAAARQAGARGAVRGRAAEAWRWRRACGAIPDPVARRDFVSCSCAPAHGDAINLQRQSDGVERVRGAVLSRTAREPRQNHHHIEIIGELRPVLWFWVSRARDVRVRADAGARMHMCARKHRTTEPHLIIEDNHGVSGSRPVLARFSSEPGVARGGEFGGKAREINKIVGGYRAFPVCAALQGRLRGRAGGRGRKSFGDGARRWAAGAAGALGLVAIGGIEGGRRGCSGRVDQGGGVLGRNGGFLRVCGVRSGHVGTAMLERSSQSRRNPTLLACRRQLRRLTGRDGAAWPARGEAAGGSRSPARGGGPPSGASRIPSSSTHAIFSRPGAFGTAIQHDCFAARASGRPGSDWQTGSGEAGYRVSAPRGVGRGGVAGLEVRRSGETSGGAAHVN